MDISELKSQMNKLEKELKEFSPNYKFFKTEIGKKFEHQFEGLMNFTNIINALSFIPTLYSIFSQFINSFQNEELRKYQLKILNNEPLTEQEQKELEKKSLHIFTSIINSFETNLETKRIVTNFIERINSYFFLAFYAYLDVYIDSIYEFLESKLTLDDFLKLKSKFTSKKYKNDQLNSIKNSLLLIDPKDLGSILKGRTWKESFDTLLDRRHFMAHDNPIARYQMLDEKFNKVIKKAEKKLKQLPNQFTIKNEGFKQIEKIINELKMNFVILFTLFEIGKDCYSYLALIDILIFDYIENYSN